MRCVKSLLTSCNEKRLTPTTIASISATPSWRVHLRCELAFNSISRLDEIRREIGIL